MFTINQYALFITLILLSFMSLGGLESVYDPDNTINEWLRLSRAIMLMCLILYFSIKFLWEKNFLARLKSYEFIFLIYFLVNLISSVLNGFQPVSMYFTITLLVPFFLISYLSAKITNRSKLTRVLCVGLLSWCVILLFSTAISIIIDPINSLRINYDWRLRSNLISVGSNGLSWVALLAILLTLMLNPRFTLKNMLYVTFPFLVIILTQSRTTFVAIFLILVFLLLFKRKTKYHHYLVAWSVIFFGLSLGLWATDQLFNVFSRGEAQFFTLSGRLIIWELIVNAIAEKPVLGWGLSNGVKNVLLDTDFHFISQVHNSFLDVIMASGFVGFSLWLLVLFHSLKIFKKRKKQLKDKVERRQIVILQCIIIAYFPKMFTSSEFVYADPSFIILFIILALVNRFSNDAVRGAI